MGRLTAMKTVVFSAVIAVFTSTIALADFTGRVVGIADGDTVRVMRGGACAE